MKPAKVIFFASIFLGLASGCQAFKKKSDDTDKTPRAAPTAPDTGKPDTGKPDTGKPETAKPDPGKLDAPAGHSTEPAHRDAEPAHDAARPKEQAPEHLTLPTTHPHGSEPAPATATNPPHSPDVVHCQSGEQLVDGKCLIEAAKNTHDCEAAGKEWFHNECMSKNKAFCLQRDKGWFQGNCMPKEEASFAQNCLDSRMHLVHGICMTGEAKNRHECEAVAGNKWYNKRCMPEKKSFCLQHKKAWFQGQCMEKTEAALARNCADNKLSWIDGKCMNDETAKNSQLCQTKSGHTWHNNACMSTEKASCLKQGRGWFKDNCLKKDEAEAAQNCVDSDLHWIEGHCMIEVAKNAHNCETRDGYTWHNNECMAKKKAFCLKQDKGWFQGHCTEKAEAELAQNCIDNPGNHWVDGRCMSEVQKSEHECSSIPGNMWFEGSCVSLQKAHEDCSLRGIITNQKASLTDANCILSKN